MCERGVFRFPQTCQLDLQFWRMRSINAVCKRSRTSTGRGIGS